MRSERLDCGEYGLCMARHFHLAPFLTQDALASIRNVLRSTPMNLRPYMLFSLNHAEQFAHSAVFIREQLERETTSSS